MNLSSDVVIDETLSEPEVQLANPDGGDGEKPTAPAETESTAHEAPEGETTSAAEVIESTGSEAAEGEKPSEPEVADPAGAEAAEGDKQTAAQAKSAKNAPRRRIAWTRVLALAVLPGLAMLLAVGAGYLKWVDGSARGSAAARDETVKVATDATIAMLSYKPDTVEKDLGAARDRLTGHFKDAYTSLTHDVVIPGAQQKKITAVANVPAAASVSATQSHAVVLVFVNQTILMGNDPPTSTASSVRITMDKVGDRWLISEFDPV
jgi:Mce-associated membrane protein